MQTKKRATGRNSREVANPRVPRQQKKSVDNGHVQGKKVTELITSSAKKKKVVGTLSRAVEESAGGTDLETKFRLVDSDDSKMCLGHQAEHESHNSLINKQTFMITFGMGTSNFRTVGRRTFNLIAQDHMSAEVRQEDEDSEGYDDFDPYFFIKNSPDLSSVVPTFQPLLLPKQTRSYPSTTLVLDFDETLVHSTLEQCDDADFTFLVNFNLKEHTVYVRCRPHLRDFLEGVSDLLR